MSSNQIVSKWLVSKENVVLRWWTVKHLVDSHPKLTKVN